FQTERLPPKHWAVFKKEHISSAKSLKPRTDDIFVCTYSKCGTTWIQHIVHQLLGKTEYEVSETNLNKGEKENGQKAPLFVVSPMIESVGGAFVDAMESPRILKSHLPYSDIPKGGGAKYIFAVRIPKDCLTSFFHHHRNLKVFNFENGSFDLFFDIFMEGRVAVGDYFDHLNSWLEASSLASMKVNQGRWIPDKWQRGEFIRKGGSRNWKEHFSYEQSLRMDKRFRERCGLTAAAEWWREEMAWNDEDVVPTAVTPRVASKL
ncbi:hypothetical protein PMAYCL1PPCAC_15100, partial [Pristionchus mayeri]